MHPTPHFPPTNTVSQKLLILEILILTNYNGKKRNSTTRGPRMPRTPPLAPRKQEPLPCNYDVALSSSTHRD